VFSLLNLVFNLNHLVLQHRVVLSFCLGYGLQGYTLFLYFLIFRTSSNFNDVKKIKFSVNNQV